MMNIMYRHIMYRDRRDAPRRVSTLRVGVCCVEHCRVGVCRVEHCRVVVCRVVVCRIGICRKRRTKVNITTLQQHYKKTTINNQEQTRQHPLTAHCSKLTAHYFQYSFRLAIHKQPLYPRHARLVLLLLYLAM